VSEQIVIIGGGISGTAAAWELATRGANVTLLERGDLASMASGWTLAGVRQSGRHPAELPLAQAAVQRWEVLGEALGADLEYRQGGNLRLAMAPDEVEKIKAVIDTGNAAGIAMTWLEPADVRDLAPFVTEEVYGASLCPTDGHANPVNTVQAFADAATRAGARIVTGAEVISIVTQSGRVTGVATAEATYAADVVIVAAGIYTPQLLAPLEIDFPLLVTHVAAVLTVPARPLLQQVIGLASGGFAGRQQVDGRFRLTVPTGPWPETRHDEFNVQPTLAQVEETIGVSTRVLPGLAELRLERVWGGLIDRTPDVIPVIERSADVAGLVFAAGFSGHGFCLGPVTGAILADLALTGATELPIEPFALARFADRPQQAESLQLHG
jgi:sarcosine oxidase subunit beta